MPKRLIKKYFPDPKTIKEHKHLKVFGSLLHDPNLWHLNRRSFAGALAVGLFIAFIPLPTQMIIAAAAAIIIRVNLPISVATVWVTNPITMPPMFYAAYWVGATLMDIPASAEAFEFSIDALMTSLGTTWKPFLLGCFVLGTASSASGYLLARGIWRWLVIKKWLQRNVN
ncbi:MAG: ATP-binding protein [Piscirickettsiaceae bacterium]|nr:MAG: ATP-binding protein [Piscirickettsiaceae bacterium]